MFDGRTKGILKPAYGRTMPFIPTGVIGTELIRNLLSKSRVVQVCATGLLSSV